MRVAVWFIGFLLCGVMSNTCAQVIYKWVDGENVTHFSAQPPEGVEAERTTISIQHTNRQSVQNRADTTAAENAAVKTRKNQEKEQAAEEKTRAKEEQVSRAELCTKAKARREKYNTSRRLYRNLENGEREYLTDDELDSERAAAEELVREWCG